MAPRQAITRVVLDNATIHGLLQRPEVVSAFPFMAQIASQVAGKKSGCGSCGNKNRNNSADFEGIKAGIAQMGMSQKQQLKTFLNAGEVRLVFKNFRGQTVRQTF